MQFSTNKKWYDEIPSQDWLCILNVNDVPRRYINEVISNILNNDVSYVCTVGKDCEKIHDLIDEEIGYRGVDIDNLHLPNHHIMTTWHNDLKEGVWFGLFAAHHDEVEIKSVIILNLTNENEMSDLHQILSDICRENKN